MRQQLNGRIHTPVLRLNTSLKKQPVMHLCTYSTCVQELAQHGQHVSQFCDGLQGIGPSCAPTQAHV